MFQKLAI